MKIGLIGIGKMGYQLALNMVSKGHLVHAFDESVNTMKTAANELGTYPNLESLIMSLDAPRVIWLMLPAGKVVDEVIDRIIPLLDRDDILIDGGNSNYNETVNRYQRLKEYGIHLLDVGTSGGVEGARNGICAMIGGEIEVFESIKNLFEDISTQDGYLYTGPSGSGHFLKMIHNGIEYGMMQSIAEGFEILEKSDYEFDYEKVAKVWNHGSVIRSWLMELLQKAFVEDPQLQTVKGVINSSGEGLWTVETALKLQVPAPVITMSLMTRYRSLQDETFTGKVVAILRNQFGGHDFIPSNIEGTSL